MEITPPEYHERELVLIMEQACKRGYTDLFEKEYVRPDGRRVPVSVRIRLLRDAEGNPQNSSVSRGTSRKKSPRIRLSRKATAFTAPDGKRHRRHLVLRPRSGLHYVSPSVEKLLGWTPAEVIAPASR